MAIVPLRDISSDANAIRNFAGTTLIDITLENLFATENINMIIVSTPNQKLLNYLADRYHERIILDERPIELARLNTHIDDTLDYIVDKYNIHESDTFSIVNYEYPFRKSFYIDKAINTLYLFNADSVLSVTKENANFYSHQGDGLKPFNSNRNLRLERDFIYREVGGIHVVSGKYFKSNGQILGVRTSHVVLDEKSTKAVITEEDFEYLEYLYKRGL